jgi:dTMP kinase
MRGRLIVFEGLDGAGKTTQIDLLSSYLQQKGFPVVITRWNSSRLVSKAIKRAKKAQLLTPYLYSTLHAADFMYRLENIIVPSLYEGYCVIADRYAFTAFARDIARSVNRSWVEHIYKLAPKPDLAFFCKTTVEVTLERIIERSDDGEPSFYESGMDVIHNENPREAFREFQNRVQSEYDWICKDHGLIQIDTARSIEDVHRYVASIIEESIKTWNEEPRVRFSSSSPAAATGEVDSKRSLSTQRSSPNFTSSHRYPGKLIVIEGVDKHATALQANLLYGELRARGYDVRLALTGESWVGEVERKAVRKKVLSLSTKVLLSASEIALQYEQVLLPALSDGAGVVMDGYLAGVVARYSAHGMRNDWFHAMFETFTVKPDTTFFLNAPLHDLMKKKKTSGYPEKLLHESIAESRKEDDLQNLIDLTELREMIDCYSLFAEREHWHNIAQVGSQKEIHRQIYDILFKDKVLAHISHGPVNSAFKEMIDLFSRYDQEYNHPRAVAEMAVALFDQTAQLHHYSTRERELLYCAAFLHDIGHALSDTRHADYTFDAIQQHEFSSFSNQEKEIVANVAYLHRMPYAKVNFERLAKLHATNQIIVKHLASLLRIADALDDTGKRVVHDVRCYEENGAVVIDLRAVGKALPERAAVLRKADMFEQVYQKPVVVVRNGIEKRVRKSQKQSPQEPRCEEPSHE